jgi:endonuclease/exonuclease/phosphatase family metal-dependent hydrolase
MKIITWNILAGEFVKKSYYKNFNFELVTNRNKRINKIIENINMINPDLILLQEVMYAEYEYLKKKYNSQYKFTNLCRINWDYSKKSESGNIIIYRKKIFKVKMFETNIIYDTKVFGQNIVLTYKTNKNRKKPVDIQIINIHLDDIYSQKRNAQINIIRKLIEEYNLEYCIVGGDFNQEFNKNSKLYMINNFTTQNTFLSTYYVESNINIDNILTKGFGKCENKEYINVDTMSKNEIMENIGSDHIPVIIKIKI